MADIQRFLQEVSSLYWWIVLFVGVIIGIASNGIYKLLEMMIGRYITSYRIKDKERKTQKEKRKEEILDMMVSDNYFLRWYELMSFFRLILGSFLTMASSVLLFILVIQFVQYPTELMPPDLFFKLFILFLISIFQFVFGIRLFIECVYLFQILTEAYQRLSKNIKEELQKKYAKKSKRGSEA